MEPFDYPDRESRFDDACKFAAALVVVGLIVFAGEASMHRATSPALSASDGVIVSPPDYISDALTLDALAPDPHLEVLGEAHE